MNLWCLGLNRKSCPVCLCSPGKFLHTVLKSGQSVDVSACGRETCDIHLIIPSVSSMICSLWFVECVVRVVVYIMPLFVIFVVGRMSCVYSTHTDAQAKLKLLTE